jgi:uncharacterized protein
MKLHPDASNTYSIQGYSNEGVVVNGQTQPGAMVLCAVCGPKPWGVEKFENLVQSHFDELLTFKPELIIFGSGPRLQFPSPGLLQGLIKQGVGVETMDSGAACRTFNVLAGEGRRVVLALLPGFKI